MGCAVIAVIMACQREKEVNGMKKILSIGLAVILVVALATAVMAFAPGGREYGRGMGMMGQYCGTSSNLTPVQSRLTQFQTDKFPLRQKIFQLRTELMTLMSQPAPDQNAIVIKQKEMMDLRTAIQQKAAETGVAGFGPGYYRGGRGMGICGVGW